MPIALSRRRYGLSVTIGLPCLLLTLTGCNLFDALFRADEGDEDRVIWHVKNHRNIGQPLFDDSSVYFLGDHHEVTAVDKSTGRVRWSIILPVPREFTLGTGGATAPGQVLVGDQDRFALDPASGDVLWRFVPTDGANAGRGIPTVVGNVALVGSTTGHAYAVELTTGRARWATHLVPRTRVVVYQPRVADGAVFVSFRDNEIAANGEPQGGLASLDLGTGAIRWVQYVPHNVDPAGPTGVLAPVVAGSVARSEHRVDLRFVDREGHPGVRSIERSHSLDCGHAIRRRQPVPMVGRSFGLPRVSKRAARCIQYGKRSISLGPESRYSFRVGAALDGSRAYLGGPGVCSRSEMTECR